MVNNLQQTKRIEYIDALRGFTMLLVVYSHVATFCWQVTYKGISINDYLLQIRMPMFFFISGFVFFKAGIVWNVKQTVRFFRKKIPVQILSPFLFFAIFTYTHKVPLIDGIYGVFKEGYWFTFVLFIYYVFYVTINFCVRNRVLSSVFLLLLGLLLFYINYPPLFDSIPLSDDTKSLLSLINWQYFIFFVIGALTREHFHHIEILLNSKWFLPICIAFYFLINAFVPDITINNLLNLFCSLTGVIVLFSFFRINQSSFSKDCVLGKTFQYIGKRTLDIYLIHFFLIPENLNFITVFVDHPMPIIEATASLIITALIVAGCLLISNIIRLSPFLAHWLFGVKYPSTSQLP